jgi:hypothetical protein
MTGILMASVGNSYGSAPVNTVAPAVTGTATFGQTLTTTNGTWTGAPAPTFAYQWQRVTTNISGATSSTYVLVAADVGNTIRCVVTATNSVAPGGVSANSNSTAAVAAAVPGAPTIGTATATGSSTATVSYTAPASDGGGTITSYTATSSPGGGSGTISQAGSGTITVTGLSGNTSYTFTVTATNSAGTGPASGSSNSITTTPAIGAAYAGGFFTGQVSYPANGIPSYNIVVAPASTGIFTGKWKTTSTGTGGTGSVIDGVSNTAAQIAAGASDHPCAQFCDNLTTGGFSDWYMPAAYELEISYFNLKPTTGNNSTFSGNTPNVYAVPARGGGYSAIGNPSQTSVTAFQSSGSETFGTDNYWASTEASYTNAWRDRFNDGYLGTNLYKAATIKVRAVRRVAV